MLQKIRSFYAWFLAKRVEKKIARAQRAPDESGWRYVGAKLGTYYAGALYNDLRFGPKKQIRAGKIGLHDRAAIYLIFPNKGLLESHLDGLNYLLQKGYAPVVVSNVRLSEEDRATLLDHAFLVIERHNHGYDFGGYRDGVLALEPHLEQLKYLAIFNDSCWFPIHPNADWLNEAEAMALDYVGAASSCGMPRPKITQFRNLVWNYNAEDRSFHYTSYALLIGAAILKNPEFLTFWKKFPVTNIKRLVIRRGEVGLTRWVIRHGYSHGSTLNFATLAEEIYRLPRSELKQMVKQLLICTNEPRLQKCKDEVLSTSLQNDLEMANLILMSILIQGASYAVGEYLINHQGFSFLKKAPLWFSADSSQLMLAFIETLKGDFGAHIRAEAAILAQRAPKTAATLDI